MKGTKLRCILQAVWILAFSQPALAQTQQFSLKQELQNTKSLASWKALGPVKADPKLGLDRLQRYALAVYYQEEKPGVSLLLGTAKGQSFVRYVSVGINGPVNRASEKAHSTVSLAAIKYCLHLGQTEQDAVREAMRGAMSKFKGQAILEKFSTGKVKGEVSLKYTNPTVDIVLTLERPDSPGQNGWKAFCALEP
jgi:hypothetical protein